MFKFFLLLVIFTLTTLEASYYYDIGKKHFYNQEYQKAIMYFKEAKDNYSNMDMLIMWAESEKALGRKLYLIAAYERILNLNPNNFEIAMKLNGLYRKRDMDGQVINTIDKFNYNDFENSYRGYISKFLHYNSGTLKKLHSSYYVNILSDRIEYVYVKNNSTYEQKILKYPFKTKTYYNIGTDYSYVYDLDNKGLFLKTDTELHANIKSDSSLLNTSSAKVGVELGKKISNIIITMPLSFKLNNIHNYYKYNILEMTPKTIILLDEKHILDFSLIYSKLKYDKEDMNVLDYDTYGINSTMRYMIGNNNLHIGISYLKIDSVNPKNRSKLFLSNYMPVENFNINFKANLIIDEYKNSLSNKQDIIIDICTEFYTKPIDKTRFLYKMNYLSKNTNYEGLNYDKLILSFGLEFNY